jgi:protein-tyrosine phosphatase
LVLIDVHCHILPGIDDGPETLDGALAMCRIAVEDGIDTIVATPHCYKGRYENDASTILPAYDLLKRRVREAGIDLNLQVAGDMHIDPDLASFLKDNPSLCTGGRFVLVELPSDSIPRLVPEFLFSLRLAGFAPILTHPERNRMIQHRPALVEEWMQSGTFTQVTAMSLTGDFGAEPRNAAFALLERGGSSPARIPSRAHPASLYKFLLAKHPALGYRIAKILCILSLFERVR